MESGEYDPCEFCGKEIEMEVHEATDGIEVQPNSVYVILPNRSQAVFHGKLQLTELERATGITGHSHFRTMRGIYRLPAGCPAIAEMIELGDYVVYLYMRYLSGRRLHEQV